MDMTNYWALIVAAIAAVMIIEIGIVLAIYSIMKGVKELRKSHLTSIDTSVVAEPSHVANR